MTLHSPLRQAVFAALLAFLIVAACAKGRPPAGDIRQVARSSQPDQQLEPFEMLDPAAAGHVRGREDAPVRVIEFSDFGCPYCARFALEIYPALHREYVETGKVQWRYVTIVMGRYPNGAEAARAAECAAEQGEDAFWAVHDLLYARQPEWTEAGEPEALFGRYVADAGLDTGRFESCYRENRSRPRVMAGIALAAQSAVRGAPTFFINGVRVEGVLPVERFRRVLDEVAAAQ